MNTVRTAVRRFLDAARIECGVIAVACSGGADSLALADATVHYGQRRDIAVVGLVVDHGLQPESANVAARAVEQLTALGCTKTQLLTVQVPGSGNVEAAARAARYVALDAARPHPDALVLLGHTLDDQAETVLLGLGRGSGPRSIAGMRELDPPWGRPLLAVRRTDTAAACASLGLIPWVDPHNSDPRFRRARLRAEVLPLLEDVLAGGVAEALARTAAQLREDCDALDALAADLLASAAAAPTSATITEKSGSQRRYEPHLLRDRAEAGEGLDTEALRAALPAVRRRALRRWLLDSGVPELTDAQLRAVDALVGAWRGQGAVALPGDVEAGRDGSRLYVRRPQSR